MFFCSRACCHNLRVNQAEYPHQQYWNENFFTFNSLERNYILIQYVESIFKYLPPDYEKTIYKSVY